MAIPKKKRRIITVDQTEYYWRKESNRCLYIETGQSPNFIIKGYFEKGYFAAPQVVLEVNAEKGIWEIQHYSRRIWQYLQFNII